MRKPEWEATPSSTANHNFYTRKRNWEKLGGTSYDFVVFNRVSECWDLILNGERAGAYESAQAAIKAEREL